MKISVGEVLDILEKEEKGLQLISEKLGMPMSAITNKLRELHYEYEVMEDVWIWKGSGIEERESPFVINTKQKVYSRELTPINLSSIKDFTKPTPKKLTKDQIYKKNEEQLIKTIQEAINHPTSVKNNQSGGKDMLSMEETIFDDIRESNNVEEQTILVKDIMIDLNNNLNTKEAAKKIGVGVKRFSKRLKELGYAFHQSSKKWEYEGEGQEPLNEVFLEVKPIQTTLKLDDENKESGEKTRKATFTVQKTDIEKGGKEHINVVLLNEIQSIKHLLNHKEETVITHNVIEDTKPSSLNDLFVKILELEQGDKTRKTLVINADIGSKLDNYAEKLKNKINKSDILEVALLDFFDRYPLPK